jgi:hypothetical protein
MPSFLLPGPGETAEVFAARLMLMVPGLEWGQAVAMASVLVAQQQLQGQQQGQAAEGGGGNGQWGGGGGEGGADGAGGGDEQDEDEEPPFDEEAQAEIDALVEEEKYASFLHKTGIRR